MKIYTDHLSHHTTMQMGGEARIVELESEEEVEDFFNNIDQYNSEYKLNIRSDMSNVRILGGGSNVLVGEDVKDLVFIKLVSIDSNSPLGELSEGLRGLHELNESGSNVFSIWGGTSWDDFVKYTVDKGYKDLSYLSLIPGTVGAAPIQNIGAYGAEVKDTIAEVYGYDLKEKIWKTYSNKDCKFAYRHSRFQKEKSFLITRIKFKLSDTSTATTIIYSSLKNLIYENSSAQEIRDAVISVRDSKLPRVGAVPSVGSFFHHPIVNNELAERLKIEYSDMPLYEYDIDNKKLSAGWLIENARCASVEDNTFHFYKNNHLVITHDGDATLNDLLSFTDKIKGKVREKFDMELHIEPEIIQ